LRLGAHKEIEALQTNGCPVGLLNICFGFHVEAERIIETAMAAPVKE